MKPTLRQTENHKMFELHKLNRNVGNVDPLKRSMQIFGFLPHKAISCIRGNNDKLIITDGNRRFTAASELGIPIWYILAEDPKMPIQEEQKLVKLWGLEDYLTSYLAANENQSYVAVKQYVDESKIPLRHAIAMLAGHTAGTNNKIGAFKSGEYRLGNVRHAVTVKNIVVYMNQCGIREATNSYFVQALSLVCWVPSFSPSRFQEKICSHRSLFTKQPSMQAHLEQIEFIYNRNSRDRVPLVFLAEEAARGRNVALNKNAKRA